MNVGSSVYQACEKLSHQPVAAESFQESFNQLFWDLCNFANASRMQDRFGSPMLWNGIYIAVASLFCTLAMAADLLHGLRNGNLWFPCKYFTINAASLMMITVAMKLPVDLNNPMLGLVDRFAKGGSIVFMCTMMVNLMPSLASMNDKELVTNFIAMGILVITMVVNVCIEVHTGVAYYPSSSNEAKYEMATAIISVGMILLLLVILTSSALAIPTAKRILEAKYEAGHKAAASEQELELVEMSIYEKTTQLVSRYWVMAGTGSPQFVMATSPTCSASGVLCLLIAAFHVVNVFSILFRGELWKNGSDYRWSTSVILIMQAVGVVVGSIAPLFRCFSALEFKLSKWCRNHIKVFRVESYWTQKLSDWKQSRLPLPIGSSKFQVLLHHFKNQILSYCTGLQKAIVVACKTIRLIPIFYVMFDLFFSHCLKSLKVLLLGEPISTNSGMVRECEQDHKREDLGRYVLQLHDEEELDEGTLKGITKSLDRLIKKAENQTPNNLLKLLERSLGFVGVEKHDRNGVPLILSKEPPNCWSLRVITLTSIAIVIHDIESSQIASLLSGVDEGLKYSYLVEESLNATNLLVKFQRAVKKYGQELKPTINGWTTTSKKMLVKGKHQERLLNGSWIKQKKSL